MNIAVIGLGLIGGSVCKALKARTNHTVMGMDTNENTARQAFAQNAADKIITEKDLFLADVCFVCLYPKQTVKFIKDNIDNFKKGAIITDVCGIKQYIHNSVEKLLREKDFYYIGGHPMAGKEKSGFSYSDGKMLEGASYILTKTPLTEQKAYNTVEQIITELGCKIISTTPLLHDRVIAYTSQLAHIVSSSYVKSPSIEQEKGFTGGSFQDMTRVALLEESMWKDLFLLNRDNLLIELDNIIKNLTEFRTAIDNNNEELLVKLLKEGKEIKEKHLR